MQLHGPARRRITTDRNINLTCCASTMLHVDNNRLVMNCQVMLLLLDVQSSTEKNSVGSVFYFRAKRAEKMCSSSQKCKFLHCIYHLPLVARFQAPALYQALALAKSNTVLKSRCDSHAKETTVQTGVFRRIFSPRQTRQLPRAVDLKGRLLSCQSY